MIYHQTTGKLTLDDGTEIPCVFYAGGNLGLVPTAVNNPAWQFVAMTGPLPQGWYTIQPRASHPKLGPALYLVPDPSNEMKGRAEFLFHYCNPERDKGYTNTMLNRIIPAGRNSSEGCPAATIPGSLDQVEKRRASGENRLQVVA